MELFTPEGLTTVAGASLAVTLIVAIIKQVFGLTGRAVQIVALVFALGIACAFGQFGSPQLALTTILNGAVIFAAAMGIDQAVNYRNGGI